MKIDNAQKPLEALNDIPDIRQETLYIIEIPDVGILI